MDVDVAQNVSDSARAQVWKGLYKAIYSTRYYEHLGTQSRRLHKTTTLLAILLGAGAVVPALVVVFTSAESPTATTVAVGLAGIALGVNSAVMIVGDFATKSAVALSISKECERIQADWEALWGAAERGDAADTDVWEAVAQLSERLDATTYRVLDAGFAVSDKDRHSKHAVEKADSEVGYLSNVA